MLVRDVMTAPAVAIDPEEPISDVTALLAQRGVRHFPVVEKGRVVGIVSDRDVRTVGSDHPDARPGVRPNDPVRRIMRHPVWTAHPLDPIEDTAKFLRDHAIGAMPVVEDEDLIGIVSASDLLDALVRMTGVGQAASRFEVELANRPGALARLLTRLSELDANVVSVLTPYSDPDVVRFVLRVGTIDARHVADTLRASGFDVTWPPTQP